MDKKLDYLNMLSCCYALKSFGRYQESQKTVDETPPQIHIFIRVKKQAHQNVMILENRERRTTSTVETDYFLKHDPKM